MKLLKLYKYSPFLGVSYLPYCIMCWTVVTAASLTKENESLNIITSGGMRSTIISWSSSEIPFNRLLSYGIYPDLAEPAL
jgi:hypothetical protein